jgi:hypothetical protein
MPHYMADCAPWFNRKHGIVWNESGVKRLLPPKSWRLQMATIHYRVTPHDGGWAYTLDGVFSESFPARELALRAAKLVAAEQHVPGNTTYIEYQDAAGAWHTETAQGDDRPDADVIA